MTESELTAALDVLVDRCDDAYGDWADVLGRAGLRPEPSADAGAVAAPSPPGRRPRRLGLVALAAVLLGTVALVATGFARDALSLLSRIDVEFRSSEPAPDVVRWRFEDLAIGAPPEFAPQAIASQVRTVGNLRVNGKERTIWVAPTRRGGFCYEVEKSYGGCTPNFPRGGTPSPRASVLVLSGAVAGIDPRRGALTAVRIPSVQGMVVSDEVERLTVEFADGESEDVDFVYVSPPIDAGFFAYTVPTERQSGPGRPRLVVGRNGAGEVVARQRLDFPTRRPRIKRGPPPSGQGPTRRTSPARPLPPPSAPVQRGEAHGVSISAGRNGSVRFDLRGITSERRALLEDGVSFVCFELVVRGGVTRDRTLGYSSHLQPTAGFRFNGIGNPLDGCYMNGRYGHRWPGRLDNHSVIEVPFTEAGRRFFEDRAAAGDLALFNRRLRRERHPLTAADLRVFGARIAALPSRAASPPRDMIGYWVDDSSILLRRVSSTGRRFEIVVGPNGRIRSENVGPLVYRY